MRIVEEQENELKSALEVFALLRYWDSLLENQIKINKEKRDECETNDKESNPTVQDF